MISHEHKTIFIHIPKCAGQSIETAFLTDLKLSWGLRAPLLLRPNDQPELGPKRLAHLIATDYTRCHYVSEELFDCYYRFAVIRDPWSRAVSLYHHLDVNIPFRAFVAEWLPQQFQKRDWEGSYWFVRPQADYVMTEDGRLLVDDLIRFEKLAEGFATVAAKSGLRTALPHVNSNAGREPGKPHSLTRRLRAATTKDMRDRHDRWIEYYNAGLVVSIGSLYEVDLRLFGYQTPSLDSRH